MPKAVLLWSSETNATNTTYSDHLRKLLKSLKIEFAEVDGSQDRPLCDQLWDVSGNRGEFPQLFAHAEGNYTFLGDYESIANAHEISGMLKECPELKENPEYFDQ